MRTLYNTLLVLLAVVFVCSCTKDGFWVSFGTDKCTFTGRGGVETIPITAFSDWNVSADKDWITFEQNQGDASTQSIIVRCDVNKKFGPRYATITLRSGIISKTLSVAQGMGCTYVSTSSSLSETVCFLNELTPVTAKRGYLYEHKGPLEELEGRYTSYLAGLDIPSTVKTIKGPIGWGVRVIICRAKVAPKLVDRPFTIAYDGPATLYVPEGSDYSSWVEYFGAERIIVRTLDDPSDIDFDYSFPNIYVP